MNIKVLVVEDESMVSLLIEEMLSEIGYGVVGPAACTETAMKLVDEGGFDVAILDVNLGGAERVYEVAQRLRRDRIPFAFVTGYGYVESELNAPVITKPFSEGRLQSLLENLMTTVS